MSADRWQQYPQLFALSCQDDEGENYLVLNLSETVLLEDRHLICFANHHDAFGYSQLMKASGDPTEFRYASLAASVSRAKGFCACLSSVLRSSGCHSLSLNLQ